MTALVGHDAERIAALWTHTHRALCELRTLDARDPAATRAAQTISSTIRLLEDHWLPLIGALRCSLIMVRWATSALAVAEIARTDEEVLAEVFAGTDRLTALTKELERRVARDPAFGTLLLDTAGDTDVVLFALAHGAFPTDLVAAALRDVIGAPDRLGAAGLRRAVLTDALLDRLADDPVVALELLHDPELAERLLAFDRGLDFWSDRPTSDGVARFVHAGLVGAPSTRAGLRAEAFDVFGWFIEQSNRLPVDRDGFPPGVATGLAIAMHHYVPTFIHSIDGSDTADTPLDSFIHADRTGDGLDDIVATVEELTDFFGALLHEPVAVAQLGLLVATTATDVAEERTSLTQAARFAGLLRDAGRNEDLEASLASAARAAQRGVVLDTLAAATKTAIGVGGAAKFVFDASTKLVEHVARTTDEDPAGGAGFDPVAVTVHLVQLAMIRRLSTDPHARASAGIDSPSLDWDDVADRLDGLDGLDGRERSTAVQRIVNRVRNLGGGDVLDSIEEHSVLAALGNQEVRGD